MLEETGRSIRALGNTVVSANAYLGAEPIVEALSRGAAVVITGRVADPSLGLAAQMHTFGWAADDWNLLGQGTVVGHLLECAGQLTGGYFADPGYKDVPGLARLGFPIAEVGKDGGAVMTKVPGSGGMVTARTCTEQLLYEVHRPNAYVTPDVTADFSRVRITELAVDRVSVTGGAGKPRSDTLKVSVGYADGFVGEGQISYAGPGAVARARLAQDIVAERLALAGVVPRDIRYDLIGLDALHGSERAPARPEPYEVRLRVVARTATMPEAVRIGHEVEALLTNGPAGGGGTTPPWGAAVVGHRIGPCTARIGHTRRDLRGGVAVELRQLAHTRCGDKGNTANVSVVSYDRADYPRLVRHVTVERVKEHLAGLVQGEIERYELPALGALNFVLHEALGGGVTRSLALDRHGKSLSSAFLTLEIPDAE